MTLNELLAENNVVSTCELDHKLIMKDIYEFFTKTKISEATDSEREFGMGSNNANLQKRSGGEASH